MRLGTTALICVLVLGGLGGRALADRLVTKDGQTVEGTIVAESATEVQIEVRVGSLTAVQTFKRDNVATIARTTAPATTASAVAGPDASTMSVATAADKMLRALAAKQFTAVIETFRAFDGVRCAAGERVDASAERRALAEAAVRLRTAVPEIEGRDLAGVAVVAVVALAHSCEACTGRGEVECTACGGARFGPCPVCGGNKGAPCPACHQSKVVPCPVCRGVNAQRTCSDCGGKGQIKIPGWDNGKGVITPSRSVDCKTCGARGVVNCRACQGKGSAPCATCRGSGAIACASCGGTGRSRAPCAACAAKGTVLCAACGGSGERGPAADTPTSHAPPDGYTARLAAMEGSVGLDPAAVPLDEVKARRAALERLRAIRDAGLMDPGEYARRAGAAVEGR
jgi:hypothetical protein